MAVNPPPQILNQQAPATQQPTEQQAPTGQGQYSPVQAPQFNQQSTPQPGDLPQLQPYRGLLPYMASLERQPQLQLPVYDDPTLQAIQQKLITQQQANPLLNGQSLASPKSVLAKTQAPMTIGQFASAVGQSLWQQEIVNPVHDYIETWKRDPRTALLETAVGVGAVAAIIGIEAVTGGAATPFIFGLLAASQAPNLINSWSQEIMHPSDQNLVRATVSMGSAAIAVGSPVRAFKGIKTARNLLEAQFQARKDLISTDQAAQLLMGTRDPGQGVMGIKTGVPLGKQMEALDINNVDGLRDQLDRRGISLDEGPASDMLKHSEAIQAMRNRLQEARNGGDDEGASSAVAEIKQYANEHLRDSMLSTAYHHIFLPSTPYVHVPLGPIHAIDEALQTSLKQRYDAIYGLLRRMHSGFGLQGPSDMATTGIASIKEAEALDRAAGSPHDTMTRILSHWEEMKKAAGIEAGHIEPILQALEEPEKWKALTPEHQAFGQKLRDLSDAMTAGELKYGTITHPLQGRVMHLFTGVAAATGKAQEEVEKAAEAVYTSSWLTRPVGSRSRFWKAAVDDEGNVEFQGKTRAQIIERAQEQSRKYEQTHEHRQVYAQNDAQIKSWRRAIGQHRRRKNAVGEAATIDKARQALGVTAAELVQMSKSELGKVLRAKPVARELVTGEEAVRRMFTNHIFRLQRAMYGEALQVHANLNVSKLRQLFGQLKVTHWGAEMALPQFKEAHDFPDVLPETVFQAAGNTEEAAKRLGYFLIHPATGNSKDLNYRPALYGRGQLANEITAAAERTTGAEHQSGFLNAIYKIGATSKRYIMYNPVYHGLNVAGRAIAFVMQDPSVAGSAFKAVKDLHADPAAYHDLLEEASMSGMVHADQWNVSDRLRRMQREEDGQPSFLGAVRTAIRPLDNFHKDVMEKGLWSTVDQLQLAGYLYSKQRFLGKGVSEIEARRLAGQYANNLGGMVNPLYMSRLWRHMKGLVFFAPSYWSTFLHSLQSVMPGSARLSGAMANIAGGRWTNLAPIPLRAIDYRSRIELTRAQRDWMVTYLASTAMAMDMMNVMFSGHHLWDNEQGHEWNVDVTNMPGFGGTQTSPSGEVKRSYITASPFFRQGVDLGNAIGLGHDWGFGHVFGDQTWQQQDAFHKATMAAGALADGTRRAGSTKLGQIPQVAYGLATGTELTAELGQGTQVNIDRPAALLSLAPGGFQAQRMWKTYQQGYLQYQPGTPQYEQARKQFEQAKSGLLPGMLLNFSGFPSVYHMGVERPNVDDSKFDNWVTQRDASHSRLTQYSNAVFSGQMTPLEYARHKHEEAIRTSQLSTDTWGDHSAGASLSSAYSQLATQFGLDQSGLSNQDWFERYDAFLPAWEQLLQSASPSTRAAWWDHTTMQWTDADYLEWEARHLKDTLAASIDGQGGNYIRAYQNQLFRLKPTLTVAEYQQLQDEDPYYSSYQTLLREMGRTSPLGAFVSAFSSPYSQTYIPPAGTTIDEATALAEHTGQVVVRPEAAHALATQAKQIAKQPAVGQAGGKPEASSDFLQQEQEAVAAAQAGVAGNQ